MSLYSYSTYSVSFFSRKAGAYAMDVIATTAFGLETSNQTNKEDPFSIHSKAIANTFTADNKAFLALCKFPCIYSRGVKICHSKMKKNWMETLGTYL